MAFNIESPISDLKGIGPKSAEKFHLAGIFTLGHLIRYYPRTYEKFSDPVELKEAKEGEICSFEGTFLKTLAVRYAGSYKITTGMFLLGGGNGEKLPVTWFNMPYLRSSIIPGRRYILRGLIKQKGKQNNLTQPQIFSPDEYEILKTSLRPVYPLTAGLTENALTKAMRQAIDGLNLQMEELPEDLRLKYELCSLDFALRQIHFPEDEHSLLLARKRLVFDEFLLFLLAVRQMKQTKELITHSYTLTKSSYTEELLNSLPYELTGAQMRVWESVQEDMTKPQVMSRLVQGDVGSGKTIIAFLALIMAAANGGQGALMVPTEVLATQHYAAWLELNEKYRIPFQAILLTGSMTAKEKRIAYEKIASGEVSVIIGTHALIQEKVEYHRLVLVVTDEQHRFGVKQREGLAFKGEQPHTLVMSATPIPRTLAVILYGDLDISVVDELPKGRQKIRTAVVNTSYRSKAYQFILEQIGQGHQAYIICPMVESSEAIDAENVIEYTDKMRSVFPKSVCVEMLHGRMKPNEKNAIMERFVSGEIQVLVSTTVVEVGVNVPNATVMMIENAERFGLAQLHQLRGRVGRGASQSYCILVHGKDDDHTSKRLDILHQSNDGFVIAQKDLELRGPGDLFGVRQSGDLAFGIADVYQDASVLEMAQSAVEDIISEDSILQSPKYNKLYTKLRDFCRSEANGMII